MLTYEDCLELSDLIKRIILDDIEEERRLGNQKKALHLKLVLRHFVHTHPKHKAKA